MTVHWSDGHVPRLQNAFDTLEAKRRIADQVAKIKPYKPREAARATETKKGYPPPP